MTGKTENTSGEDNAGELRNKLIKRLAMAGVLVAVLLGVLAFFDYLATPQDEPETHVFTKPVPVAPKKPLSMPVKPSSDLPEPPTVAEPPPAPKIEPSPVAEKVVEKVAEKVAENAGEVVVPSSPGKKKVAVVPVSAPEANPSSKTVRPAPESSAAPSAPAHQETVMQRPQQPPTARIVESRPAVQAAPSGVSRLFSGFSLQAGVFSSAQRAEELHAKLTLSGVPSTLETRVQVGPFRTRQEAEAAQSKLKELGVETVLVPPRGGKH